MKDIKVFLRKKNKKRQNGQEQHKNLPEDEKQKFLEYIQKYYKMRTKALV